MNVRTIVLAVVALAIAGAAAFFVRAWLSAEQAKPVQQAEEQRGLAVLVAKADLPAGTFIKDNDLRWQPWPNDTLDPTYMIEGKMEMTSLFGAVVRRGIDAGEPITPGRVVKPGDRGFLAAVLKPGMRAISIAVNETSGVSGLVFPGDRVDIILTHALPGADGTLPLRVSETVLENVRVLALDQKLDDVKGEPALASTATIEVTPKQVEMIAVVGELGRMSLSLRSLGKPEEEALAAGDPQENELLRELAASEAVAPSGAAAEPVATLPVRRVGETADSDDTAEPERGATFTLDNEVSHLIGPQNGSRGKVLVFHGATSVEVPVE